MNISNGQKPISSKARPIPQVRGWRRIVYLLAGAFFFSLGALGAILPGLPATPFLMLASFFFLRTSPKAHRALMKSRLFGPILTDWQEHRRVRRSVKVKATVVVLLTVALSLWLTGRTLVPSLVIMTLALVGLSVVWSLPEGSSSRV